MTQGGLRSVGIVVVFGLLGMGCSAAGSAVDGGASPVDDTSRSLVGGEQADASDFPSTVLLNGGCTAAKVGPRHFLTAAHCVHDTSNNSVRAGYRPGSPIQLSNAPTVKSTHNAPGSLLVVTIESTSIHGEWLASCSGTCTINILASEVPADVAVVVIAEDTPSIPSAYVDMRTMHVGDPVVVMGYGCENGLGGGSSSERHLKFERTETLPGSALDHKGSVIPPTDARYDELLGSYYLTPGRDQDGEEASLCYGDSGGPVYRDDGSAAAIVGVNAYYSFDLDNAGVAYTNWHTRLDDNSRFQIAAWLQSQGVDAVGDAPAGDPGGGEPGDTSDPAAGECGGLTFEGECDGDFVLWCEGGAQWQDCAAEGRVCGWDSANGYYGCVAP